MAQIVTITNPLTGQPAQVDQLDHTAQQIDDGLNIARNVSNHNLLDNWYFGNPVDQRQGYVVPPNTFAVQLDTTESISIHTDTYYPVKYIGGGDMPVFTYNGKDYAGTAGSYVRGYTGGFLYTIDRWKLEDSTGRGVVLINDDGSITIKNPEGNTDNVWWTQYRETSFTGEQCTISVLATEASVGSVYTGTNNLGIMLRQGMTTLTGVPTGNMAARIVVSPGNAVTMRGIKLELGTQQTLAHQDTNGNWVLNEIPDYGEQLARSQRYFTTIQYSIGRAISTAVSDGNGEVGFPIYLPTTMRVSPVFTHTGTLRVHGPGIDYSDVSISAVSTQGNIVALHVAGLSPMTTYTLDSATGGVLNFSADL